MSSYKGPPGVGARVVQEDGEAKILPTILVPKCCITCGELARDLEEHFREVHGAKYPQHGCLCGKVYTSKAGRNRHAKTCGQAGTPEQGVMVL